MTRTHRRERTRAKLTTFALVVTVVSALAACSSSGTDEPSTTTQSTPTQSTPTQSTPTQSTPTQSTPTRPASTTTATSAAQAAGVVPIDGNDNQDVTVPAGVGIPAIVHAQYDGSGSFVVEAVDAQGHAIHVIASSLGPYDGTFPLGFVEREVTMRVTANGPWHLDIAKPSLAPKFSTAIAGKGDAVLAYTGPAATARLVHADRTRFLVSIYGNDALKVIADKTGPYDQPTQLPAGPAFIAVSTIGDWSITPVSPG